MSKYNSIEMSSDLGSSISSDEENRKQSNDETQHPEIKKIVEKLSHPSESEEFMEHLLNQTLKVDGLKATLKKLSFALGAVAFLLFSYHLIGYFSGHINQMRLEELKDQEI